MICLLLILINYKAQRTPGTPGTPVFDTFPKQKNLVGQTFPRKFRIEHMPFLVRFMLLAGNEMRTVLTSHLRTYFLNTPRHQNDLIISPINYICLRSNSFDFTIQPYEDLTSRFDQAGFAFNFALPASYITKP